MQQRRKPKILNLITLTDKYLQTEPRELPFAIKHPNIFHQSTSQLRTHKFNSKKQYDFVGVKELKAFYEKSRRSTKEKRRDTIILQLNHNRSLSIAHKGNIQKKSKDKFLSKQQVLEVIDKHNTSNNDLVHMQRQEPSFIHQVQNQTFSQQNNTFLTSMNRDKNNQKYGSMEKIKYRFNHYKNHWKSIQDKREETKGYSSIIRIVEQQRYKCNRKQENSRQFSRQNINSRMWSENLRVKKGLRYIYSGNGMETFDRGERHIMLKGRNKLLKQRDWIQDKDTQCHYTFIQSH